MSLFDEIDSLSLSESLKLHEELLRRIRARFEQHLALLFSDVAGSTPYFAQHGDAAGHRLLQRHVDLLQPSLDEHEGRLVDRAGDGVFCVFPEAWPAAQAAIEFERRLAGDNAGRPPEHQLQVRVGIHWGPVLVDDELVSGDAVNLSARIADSARVGEIRLSRDAEVLLPAFVRLRTRKLSPVTLKGILDPISLSILDWHEPGTFPTLVRIEETGEVHPLPQQDVIAFGRLAQHDGRRANDIVLRHPDPSRTNRISRWHFELHREAEGFRLQPVSKAGTAVDGEQVAQGSKVPVRPGTRIEVAGALRLVLTAPADDPTIVARDADPPTE